MVQINDGTEKYAKALRQSGLSIYDRIEISESELWIPTPILEHLLNSAMRGITLEGLPLRTRSKKIKQKICQVLGYPVPGSFKRTRPRFPGQNFDCYVQKSNNLQIWNEEIVHTRRYVIIRVEENDVIGRVKVIKGDTLALLDTTGTLTKKYQARWILGTTNPPQLFEEDTNLLRSLLKSGTCVSETSSPVSHPQANQLLRIQDIFQRLLPLVGETVPYLGHDQERKRSEALHRLICRNLGYADYSDSGQFPDVLHQLLELKLQTSSTIDLGLMYPSSVEPLEIPKLCGNQIRICDVRYALFYAVSDGPHITLTNLVLTTGENFFNHFEPMQGQVLNKKLQIPLPANFFNE